MRHIGTCRRDVADCDRGAHGDGGTLCNRRAERRDAPAETPADSETRAEVPATDDAAGTAPATDAAAAEPAPTDAVPAEPEPPAVGGRSFATTVEPDAQFDGNPFPDLVVDDIGRGGEANIANILPSDRPVLLWTWAPH